jgi:hypothetical protein
MEVEDILLNYPGDHAMHRPNRSSKDYMQHDRAISSIADHYHIQIAVIRTLYENELDGLLTHARIKTFLSVLTIRHVKEILHRNTHLFPH